MYYTYTHIHIYAEYGWKLRLNKEVSQASVYRHMRKTTGGTVSSISRFQTVLFQQHPANLSQTLEAKFWNLDHRSGQSPAAPPATWVGAMFRRLGRVPRGVFLNGGLLGTVRRSSRSDSCESPADPPFRKPPVSPVAA